MAVEPMIWWGRWDMNPLLRGFGNISARGIKRRPSSVREKGREITG
jgi:hypothetical protein